MIRFYTPAQWHNVFNHPEIVIDDSGFIYSHEEYRKALPSPSGKIDWASGNIYGSDYASILPRVIGKVETKQDVTMIYGEDFASFYAHPLLYIKGNTAYTHEEFRRTFPSVAAYVEGSFSGGESSSAAPQKEASATSAKKKAAPTDDYIEDPSDPIVKFFNFLEILPKAALLIGIIIFIPVFSVWCLREAFIVNDEYFDYLVALIVGCAAGGIYAYYKIMKSIDKDPTYRNFDNQLSGVYGMVYMVCCVIFWIHVTAQVILDVGFPWYLIFIALLDVAISMLFSIFPALFTSIITGAILYFSIPKEIRKQKPPKKKSK